MGFRARQNFSPSGSIFKHEWQSLVLKMWLNHELVVSSAYHNPRSSFRSVRRWNVDFNTISVKQCLRYVLQWLVRSLFLASKSLAFFADLRVNWVVLVSVSKSRSRSRNLLPNAGFLPEVRTREFTSCEFTVFNIFSFGLGADSSEFTTFSFGLRSNFSHWSVIRWVKSSK